MWFTVTKKTIEQTKRKSAQKVFEA